MEEIEFDDGQGQNIAKILALCYHVMALRGAQYA